jgi:protein tyrosine/serine phosphatase
MISSTYYRGAQPKGHDYADLAALGIKTVIDLTDDDADPSEPGMVKGAGMKAIRIPMSTHTPPTAQQLSQFLKIVDDPARQPVYVHCVGGRHRTGVMTAAYRMTDEGWSGDKAFAEMKQFKYGADFLHPEFKQFVYAFKPEAKEPKGAVPTVVALTQP